jgi:LPS export ABC transporter permease LptF/LPS export ABC transporter permease LptG
VALLTRLDRYVMREVAGPTLVGFLAYTGFMVVRGLVLFSDLVLQSESPFVDMLRVAAFSLPHIVVLTLPIAFLLGLLIAFGRMSADSEVIALRASGVDPVRFYKPVGLLALVCFAVTLVLMLQAVPRGNRLLSAMRLRLATFAVAQRIQPGVFSPEFGGIRIYVEEATPDRRVLTRLFVSDRSQEEGERLTVAPRGWLEIEEATGRLWLRLDDAVTHHVQSEPRKYDISSGTVRVLLREGDPRLGTLPRHLREQLLPEMLRTSSDPKKTVFERRTARVEIQKKFSLPAACLLFALVGVPLGIVTRRGGRAAGFAVSVAVVLGYYVLLASGEARAVDGKVSPALAMWLPNAILLVVGIVALERVRRDRNVLPGLPPWWHAWRDGIRAADESPAPGADAGSPRLRSSRRARRLFLLVDGYVAGRFLRTFSLALLSMSFLYLLIDYLEISESIVKNRIGAGVVLAYYEALLAPILLDLVPFAFLAAALITTAGLVRSGEATALLAHGLSLFRMVASLLLFAGVTGVVLFFYAERIVPRAAADADRYRARILKHPEPPGSAATRWFRGRGGRFLSADAYDAATRGLAGLSVVELDPATFQMTSRSSAGVGQVVPGRGILAQDGWMRSFGPDGSSLFMAQEGRFFIDASEAGEGFATSQSDPRQMTVRQLARFIDARRRAGADVASLATNLYLKPANACSALLLTLLGLPFAFRYGRRGAVAGIGVAILLGLTYFFVTSLFVKLGEAGALPPVLAAWSANALFGLGAAWGLLGVRT